MFCGMPLENVFLGTRGLKSDDSMLFLHARELNVIGAPLEYECMR